MKKYILFFSLCLLGLYGQAQTMMSMDDMFPKNATYFIKGGNEIAYSKIDSVLNSWGGKFSIEHGSSDSKIYLSPTTAADTKKMEDQKLITNSMLGKPAPDFSLTDINGKQYSLASLKGKVVVLNFWFTACVPCAHEMPELNKVKKAFDGKNVVFLALALDNSEQIKSFLKKHAFDYSILTDAKAVDALYNVSSWPTSMVIDENGIIRFVQISGQDIENTLPLAINKAL